MPAETTGDVNRTAGAWAKTIILIIVAIGSVLLASRFTSQAR